MTRHTGVQSGDSRDCPQCFTLAGYENDVLDGNFQAADVEGVRYTIAEAVARGGDEAKIRASFPELIAALG